jgi:hypothetical protein
MHVVFIFFLWIESSSFQKKNPIPNVAEKYSDFDGGKKNFALRTRKK